MWCNLKANNATIPSAEFAHDAPLPFPSYKFLLCSHHYVREYRQGERCPFASRNMCEQKDGGDCAEKPFFPTRSPPYTTFSYHSKYSTYPADCRFSSRIRHRFLFFVLLCIASRFGKAAWAEILV